MAGTAAKASNIFGNGYHASLFLDEYTDPAASLATEECTGFTANSVSRVVTLADCTMELSGVHDSATGANWDIFTAAVATGEDIFNVLFQGDTVGDPGIGFTSYMTDFELGGAVSGLVRSTVTLSSKIGHEMLLSYHALAARTTTGNGDTVDNGASSANGGSAYLQVPTASASDTLDVTVRHSNDNFSADDNLLATFTQVAASNAFERITFTGTVERYVRIVYTIGGSDPSFTFWAGVHRA